MKDGRCVVEHNRVPDAKHREAAKALQEAGYRVVSLSAVGEDGPVQYGADISIEPALVRRA